MRRILYALLSCVCLTAGMAAAATKVFYVTDEQVDFLHLVRMKDLSVAPTGLYVQKCVSGTSGTSDFAPPTNWAWAAPGTDNAFTNYLPPDCYEYQVGTCKVGDDDGGVGFTPGKAGQVSGPIGSSDATRRGWLRAFSSTSITGSAYYGDTPGNDAGRTLNSLVDVYQWSSDPVISNINPAYVIPFAQPPPTQTVNASVSGTVLVGPGSNVLPASVITVEYSPHGSGTWQTLAAVVAGDGTFLGTVPGPFPRTIDVRARVMDAYTLRPGLPVSETYVVVVPVPEPSLTWTALVPLTAAFWRIAAFINL